MAEQVKTQIMPAECGAWNEGAIHVCIIFCIMGMIIGGVFVLSLNVGKVCPEQIVDKESLISFETANKFCQSQGFDNGGFLTMNANTYHKQYEFSILCSKSDGTLKSIRVD